jgi:prepilin-type processing-associated H-X9-DG protein
MHRLASTGRLAEITDAHSSTLMVIEADEKNAVPWMAPVDADESLVMSLGPTAKLHHPGGMNGCFVDGSVRFLKSKTPAGVRRALLSISGNDDEVTREW